MPSQVPRQSLKVFKDFACNDVLPVQGHRTPQNAVTDGYGAIEE
jgi:hypothetical protein